MGIDRYFLGEYSSEGSFKLLAKNKKNTAKSLNYLIY